MTGPLIPLDPSKFEWPTLTTEQRLAHKGEICVYDPTTAAIVGFAPNYQAGMELPWDGYRSFMDVPPPEGKCVYCFVHAGTVPQVDWHFNLTGTGACSCCLAQRALDAALEAELKIVMLSQAVEDAKAVCE